MPFRIAGANEMAVAGGFNSSMQCLLTQILRWVDRSLMPRTPMMFCERTVMVGSRRLLLLLDRLNRSGSAMIDSSNNGRDWRRSVLKEG